MTAPVVLAARATKNADLVVDCVALGYLHADMHVLDPTFGRGRFWRRWHPHHLVGCDLDPARSPLGHSIDFTELPYPRTFDAVVLDPPYKLNGTGGSHPSDDDYGVANTVRWQARHALICAGITEAARVLVAGGTLLVKCQDQVCSGAVRWQTREFADHAESVGCELVDRFDLLGHRPQPTTTPCRRCKATGLEPVRVFPVCARCVGRGHTDRVQRHALRNYSTLLVFRRCP